MCRAEKKCSSKINKLRNVVSFFEGQKEICDKTSLCFDSLRKARVKCESLSGKANILDNRVHDLQPPLTGKGYDTCGWIYSRLPRQVLTHTHKPAWLLNTHIHADSKEKRC